MNFHSDEWIMARLQEHYDEAKTLYPENRIVGIFLQGSQNYGLDIEGSDIDTKVILVPSWEDLCFNRQPVSTTHIRANNEHIDLKDIRLYMNTFRKQNINFVEILFTRYFILNPMYAEDWIRLMTAREVIAHYHPLIAARAMKGMAMEKYHAMEHRYPSKVEVLDKYGYDPKQLHHLLRLEEFMFRYLMDVEYANCLIAKDTAYLKEVKEGKHTLEEARSLAKAALESIEWTYNVFLNSQDATRGPDAIVSALLDDVQEAIMRTAIKFELEECQYENH